LNKACALFSDFNIIHMIYINTIEHLGYIEA